MWLSHLGEELESYTPLRVLFDRMMVILCVPLYLGRPQISPKHTTQLPPERQTPGAIHALRTTNTRNIQMELEVGVHQSVQTTGCQSIPTSTGL